MGHYRQLKPCTSLCSKHKHKSNTYQTSINRSIDVVTLNCLLLINSLKVKELGVFHQKGHIIWLHRTKRKEAEFRHKSWFLRSPKTKLTSPLSTLQMQLSPVDSPNTYIPAKIRLIIVTHPSGCQSLKLKKETIPAVVYCTQPCAAQDTWIQIGAKQLHRFRMKKTTQAVHFLTVKVLSDTLFKTMKNTIVWADSAQQLDFERLIKYVIKPFTWRMFFWHLEWYCLCICSPPVKGKIVPW